MMPHSIFRLQSWLISTKRSSVWRKNPVVWPARSSVHPNPKFVDKAPAAKVEEEKAKLAKYTEMKAQVEERLAQLKK